MFHPSIFNCRLDSGVEGVRQTWAAAPRLPVPVGASGVAGGCPGSVLQTNDICGAGWRSQAPLAGGAGTAGEPGQQIKN